MRRHVSFTVTPSEESWGRDMRVLKALRAFQQRGGYVDSKWTGTIGRGGRALRAAHARKCAEDAEVAAPRVTGIKEKKYFNQSRSGAYGNCRSPIDEYYVLASLRQIAR